MDRKKRTTEGILLLFASLVVLLGLVLVFLAKLPELKTEGTINVNTASAQDIAAALGIDNSEAQRIVEYREANGPFQYTASMSRFGIPRGIRIDDHLRVREPSGVIISFWVYSLLIIFGFFLIHLVLRKKAPNADPFILPTVAFLSGLGAVLLFSVKHPLQDTFVYPAQVRGLLLGVPIALIPFIPRFSAFRPWRYTYIYALASIFLVGLLALFGSGPGGAKLSLLGFQPVEFVKVLLVFFVASYLFDRWGLLLDKTGPKKTVRIPLFRDIGPLLIMYLLSLATFVLVRDLGPMLILFGMFISMLYFTTGRRLYLLAGILAVGLTGFLAHQLRLGVFDVRVDMWLHPWANSHANGMQLGQGLWGMGTGGIFGSGLGLGRPDFMPRSGSDLIFATAGEELGLIGSLSVLVLYSVLIVRGFKIALHARTDFDRLLAAALSALLGIQVLIIVSGVTGVLPLTGVTLPFVSYGRSSVVASFFMAGLLLKISQDGLRDSSAVRAETRRALNAFAVGVVVFLLGVIGIGRVFWIQGVTGDVVAGRTITTPDADGFSRPHVNPRLISIEASIPRGSIYDRNGQILATSRESELEALGFEREARSRPKGRYYPYGAAFAHIVGYVDPICGGPVGMEKWRNDDLRGFDDYSSLLPIYRHSNTFYCPKIEGRDVRLTIDARLQTAVEKALVRYAGAVRDKRTGKPKIKGAAVVLDVKTGEVLAAVSIPNFDPNELTDEKWKEYNSNDGGVSILFDRALSGAYPPGSVYKLVTASAALESGLEPEFKCEHQKKNVVWDYSGKTYSRAKITDLEEMQPHGMTGLAKAIRVSCNVYFAQLGLQLGPERLREMAVKYGFGRVPSIRKIAEDLPDNAYGQGTVLVSPMEMAQVVQTIANGGVMMEPTFVKDVRLNKKVIKTVEPIEKGRPISPETAAMLRDMMEDVVKSGTGRGVFDGLGVGVAGKTGSAENDQADRMPHSWFVGFAPADDPQIAFAVVVENGGYGRAVAGKVCREIVKSSL